MSKATSTNTVTTPDGALIPYKLIGSASPSAPLIVLSNPLLTTWDIWSPFLSHLKSSNYRILLYLTRGRTSHYGNTQPITLDLLASDIALLLDTVNVPKAAAVIGVSVGGATALNFALRYPERLDKVVVGSIFAKNPEGMQKIWEDRVSVGRVDGALSEGGETIVGDALADLSVQRWFTPTSFKDPEMRKQVDNVKATVVQSDLDGFEQIVKALYDFDLTSEMKKPKTVRALFIVGSKDSSVKPGTLQEMAGIWGDNDDANVDGNGAECIVIDEAGHFPMIERAMQWTDSVEKFLEGR